MPKTTQSTETLTTWVTVNTKSISKNIKTLHKRLPKGTKLMPVIKGNAYGHGLIETARALVNTGVDYVAVYHPEEAIELRRAKITIPILVLRTLRPDELDAFDLQQFDIAVSTFELLTELKRRKFKKPVRAHLLVDTGLGRDGFLLDNADRVFALLVGNTNINLVGLFSHFSGAESREYDSYSVMQVAFLYAWKKQLMEIGFTPITHMSATAGPFLSKEFAMEMVRPGIGMYGLWPSPDTRALDRDGTKLLPALSWYTRVNEVKWLQAGSFVGYDLSYRTKADTKVAVLPVGYADGYPRGLSSKGAVLINGIRARVIGRVMMNMIVVDVTHIPKVSVGDIATLIGTQKKETITVDELGEMSGTIHYEITTRINPLIPRIYI